MLRMQVQELGDVLDLGNVLDRMMFVQALMRTYFLLGVMAKSVPSPWASTRVQHDHQRSQGP